VAISEVVATIICKLKQPTFSRCLLRSTAPALDSILSTSQSNYVWDYVTSGMMVFNSINLKFFGLWTRCNIIFTFLTILVTLHLNLFLFNRTLYSIECLCPLRRYFYCGVECCKIPSVTDVTLIDYDTTLPAFNLLFSWRFSHRYYLLYHKKRNVYWSRYLTQDLRLVCLFCTS
jgi:hypothetical protein